MKKSSYLKVQFALILCITVGIWMLLFYLVPRGFEMTDNAFYLMAIRNYDDFTATPTMFHTIIKPLYDIGGESLVSIRLSGLFIYLLVSIFTSFIVLKYFLQEQVSQAETSKIYSYSIAVVILTASTLQYNNWVNTPNYNWLNHIGLMFFLSGLLIWLNKHNPKQSIYGPFVIMFGFGLSFWAKTPTAMLMPLMVLIILLINRLAIATLLSVKHVLSGILGAIFSLSLVFSQGDSISGIIGKLQSGIALQVTKNAGIEDIISYLQGELLEMLGLLYPIITYCIHNSLIVLIPIIVAICTSFYNASQDKPNQHIIILVRLMIFVGWLINVINITYQLNVFQIAVWSLRVFSITLLFSLLSIFTERLMTLDKNQHPSIKLNLGWVCIIFFIPSLFSFGTDSSFTLHTGWASYFYLFATIILVINPLVIQNLWLKFSVPIVLISLISYVIMVSANEPYRQTDRLYDMTINVPIQFGEDNVIVSPSMAMYIIELQEQATLATFEPQTPIIDLTRNSPGSVFLLDGRTAVFPWILGSNEPPHDFIFTLLEQWQAEDMERAWLITNINSTLEAETEILNHFGLDLSQDYEEVFTITRPYREGSQTFWRPITTP